eukprot:1152375-Pelagomonas_calceolata.AAC.1
MQCDPLSFKQTSSSSYLRVSVFDALQFWDNLPLIKHKGSTVNYSVTIGLLFQQEKKKEKNRRALEKTSLNSHHRGLARATASDLPDNH